jgi:hypothetical protein
MPISNLPLLAIYLNYDSTTGLKTFHKRCYPLKKLRRFSTDIGGVRNFIPLPAIAQMMTLEKAKLLNGELHIYFIDERWKKEK